MAATIVPPVVTHRLNDIFVSTGVPLDGATFAAIHRRLVLDCCKWDPQVGDVGTLANFPLILAETAWRQLARWAECLAAETLSAEEELWHLPQLQHRLGVPGPIRRVLRHMDDAGPTPAALRIMRFDFHPTTLGWRLSEVNSDVPGGFTEASSFTALMAEHYPHTTVTGNPAAQWTDAMLHTVGESATVALLSAPGFMEDHQIVSYLARQLRARGCRALLAKPEQLRWRDGYAHLGNAGDDSCLDALVRFYQAEWLAQLPRRCGWSHFFCGGRTPVVNPGTASMTESKRFPLVWNALATPLPTWRALLPETCDPREVPWETDEGWLLKSAYCNNGDTVSQRSLLGAREWNVVCREARWFPSRWVAQRRFDVVALESPLGPVFPCIGIYTINGRAAGAYGRIARRPLIDFEAVDVAVLIEEAAPL